jgi:hypothetical protein
MWTVSLYASQLLIHFAKFRAENRNWNARALRLIWNVKQSASIHVAMLRCSLILPKHVLSRQQMPAHASIFCADEYMWHTITTFYISFLSFRATKPQKFNILEGKKKTNFPENLKMHLQIMACIFQCKNTNTSKVHKKFEGSEELQEQSLCVFSIVFIHPHSLRLLSYHTRSCSEIRRKLLFDAVRLRSSSRKRVNENMYVRVFIKYTKFYDFIMLIHRYQ